MIVECATCPVRGQRCPTCMVTAMAGLPVVLPTPSVPVRPGEVPLDRRERQAVGVLLDAGLVSAAVAASLTAVTERSAAASA